MVAILVTAGPTREYLDEVRFFANGSSGRMGCSLAAAAAAFGHKVWLVLGPVQIEPPSQVTVLPVTSALEMQAAAEQVFPQCQVVIAAAAVADYRPAARSTGKPPRTAERLHLELVQNPDIVAGLAARKGDRIVVGFALEAASAGMQNAIARGRDKLAKKHLDLVVVNCSDAIGDEQSEVVLLYADGRQLALPRQDKNSTAQRIVQVAVELWEAKPHS